MKRRHCLAALSCMPGDRVAALAQRNTLAGVGPHPQPRSCEERGASSISPSPCGRGGQEVRSQAADTRMPFAWKRILREERETAYNLV